MNKKNKGFTLIELLAIIVILAIIAIITVPIILNVIDNAKRGTAKDSAYGYKDAISKYYVSGMLEDESIKLSGDYNVVDGKLGEYDIPFSGTKPTSGYLVYDNNILTGGCLTIDEYMVVFEEGEVKSVEVGECGSSSSLTACDTKHYTPSPGEWFNVDATTGTITGFSDAWDGTKDIVIPCTINKDDVDVEIKNIGNTAFAGKSLTSLVILDSVENLDSYSFAGNPFKKVIVGNGVETICNCSFCSAQTEELVLGNSVKEIGNNAFSGNKFKKLVIPDSVVTIGSGVFSSNTLLSEVKIGNGLKKINSAMFAGLNIEKLDLGNSVEVIETLAFAGNKLTSVSLPDSVKIIQSQAFVSNNSLIDVTISKNVSEIGTSAFYSTSLKTIYNKTGKSFDWGSIGADDSTGTYTFEIGNVVRSDGSIIEVKK